MIEVFKMIRQPGAEVITISTRVELQTYLNKEKCTMVENLSKDIFDIPRSYLPLAVST